MVKMIALSLIRNYRSITPLLLHNNVWQRIPRDVTEIRYGKLILNVASVYQHVKWKDECFYFQIIEVNDAQFKFKVTFWHNTLKQIVPELTCNYDNTVDDPSKNMWFLDFVNEDFSVGKQCSLTPNSTVSLSSNQVYFVDLNTAKDDSPSKRLYIDTTNALLPCTLQLNTSNESAMQIECQYQAQSQIINISGFEREELTTQQTSQSIDSIISLENEGVTKYTNHYNIIADDSCLAYPITLSIKFNDQKMSHLGHGNSGEAVAVQANNFSPLPVYIYFENDGDYQIFHRKNRNNQEIYIQHFNGKCEKLDYDCHYKVSFVNNADYCAKITQHKHLILCSLLTILVLLSLFLVLFLLHMATIVSICIFSSLTAMMAGYMIYQAVQTIDHGTVAKVTDITAKRCTVAKETASTFPDQPRSRLNSSESCVSNFSYKSCSF
jgi:hypothetical protein